MTDYLKARVNLEPLAKLLEQLAYDLRAGNIEVTKARSGEHVETHYPEDEAGHFSVDPVPTGFQLGTLSLAWKRVTP